MSQTFKDDAGREWKPFVDCLTLVQFEDQTGVSLLNVQALNELLAQRSLSKFMRLAFLACREDSAKHNLSFNEFCAGFVTEKCLPDLITVTAQALTAFSKGKAAA